MVGLTGEVREETDGGRVRERERTERGCKSACTEGRMRDGLRRGKKVFKTGEVLLLEKIPRGSDAWD